MKRLALITIPVLLLTGCMPSLESRMAEHRAYCSTFGFEPGSEEYAKCLQKQDQQYRREWQTGQRGWLDMNN